MKISSIILNERLSLIWDRELVPHVNAFTNLKRNNIISIWVYAADIVRLKFILDPEDQ